MGAVSCKLGGPQCRVWNSMEKSEEQERSEIDLDVSDTVFLPQRSCDSEGFESTFSTSPRWPLTEAEQTAQESSKSKLELVTRIPIFERWPQEQLATLAEAMVDVTFSAGEAIEQVDEAAAGLYIVYSGIVAEMIIDSPRAQLEKQTTLQRGDFFCEASLTGGKNIATYVAETDIGCFLLIQSKFLELGLQSKLLQKKRDVVGRQGTSNMGREKLRCSRVVGVDLLAGEMDGELRGPETPEEETFILEALKSNQNLAQLMPSSENFALELVRSARKFDVEEGEDVIVEGDLVTDFFYVIDSGEFVVLKLSNDKKSARRASNGNAKPRSTKAEMQQVRVIGRGTSFGELALLYRSPRSATVRALIKSSVWYIGRAVYKEMLQKVAEENSQEYLSYIDALEILSSLSPQEKLSVAKMLDKVYFKKGDVLFRRGDRALAFYILLDGTVQLDKEGMLPRTLNAHLSTKQFQSFGDRTLLEDVPRETTVTVLSECAQFFMLDSADFQSTLGHMKHLFDGKRNTRTEVGTKYMRILDKLDVLSSLTQDEKRVVAQALKNDKFKKGDVIFSRCSPADKWYILLDGTLEAFDGANYMTIQATNVEDKVCHFGDYALLDNGHRRIDVTVKSDTAKVLTLDRESFKLQLSKLKDVFLRQRAVKRVAHKRVQIRMKDLSVLNFLCRTATGHVESCRHKVTQEVFAMKSMHKAMLVKLDLRATVFRERDAWLKADSPFIVKLHTLFNEPQYLHFLCELLPGGQVSDIYTRMGFYGFVEHTRFYCAGVILALEHLHGRRIIHRDVRPENVLLSEFGYPKLTDFAVSKEVHGKTFTTCGTSEYMAPEVLVGTGHTRAVDWWAVGVLVFELMVGNSPFASEYPMDVYSNIMRGFTKLNLPQNCRGQVGDFICSLLKHEPKDRLAMRPGGADKLAHHGWYKQFDWHSLTNLTLDPPHKPQIKRTSMKSLPEVCSPKSPKSQMPFYDDDGTGWDENFAKVTFPNQEVLD